MTHWKTLGVERRRASERSINTAYRKRMSEIPKGSKYKRETARKLNEARHAALLEIGAYR